MAQDPMQALIKAAARTAAGLPGVEEGIACAGTPIESRTYKLNGRAFLFVRPGNVMLKLGPSLAAAAAMARNASPPGSLKAGAGGWVTISAAGAGISAPLMTEWVRESHALLASGSRAAKRPVKKAGAKAAGTSHPRAGAERKPQQKGT